jgi:succinoglycan biosynthesis protein ExoA
MNDTKQLPFITVCMPVRNEARFIQDTLIQLLTQDYPKDRYEIIVADGESNDGTQDIVRNIARSYPLVKLKNNPKRLSSAGRNIGFKEGKGDVFIIVDGHCQIPTRKLLKNVVECFEKSEADCLGRPQPLDPPDISVFQRAVAFARKLWIGHGGDSLIYSDFEGFVSPKSHGAIYKRHIIDTIGYVDETFDACEDVEFNLRVAKAGFVTFMSPSIKIKYYPRENLRSLFKQMFRYGRGRFKLLRKHLDTFSFNSMVPSIFVIGLIITPIFLILNIKIGVFILFFLCAYFILIISASIYICANRGFIYLKYLILIFFTLHLGLGYGFLLASLENVLRRR